MSNEIFNEWKFIKSIPQGAKPCFQDKSLVYIDEWFVTLKRRYKNEKAEKGVLHVENLIKTTIETYTNNPDKETLKKIKNLLEEALEGLKNLVFTYTKDQQHDIRDSYTSSYKKINDMIQELNQIIKSNTNFFNYIPVIIN